VIKNLISQSPLNIRRINFSIAEGILRTLERYEDGIEESLLVSKGLQKAVEFDETVDTRTTKCDETLMELRRLELVERKRIGNAGVYLLLSDGQEALSKMDVMGREKFFFELLCRKEPLFKNFVDMLQRRGRLDDDEAMQISGINSVKISFIKSILRQVPSVTQMCREGRTSFIKYVGIKPVSPNEIQKSLLREYRLLIGNKLFVRVDDLWRSLKAKYPNLSEELFDKVVLNLANDYLGKVELLQGVSPPHAKLLFDKRSDTYFHYLKIPRDLLDTEIGND